MNPIQMAVERVLTRILLTTLRADHVGVLVAKVDILDVALQRHLVEILVAEAAGFPRVPIFALGRSG